MLVTATERILRATEVNRRTRVDKSQYRSTLYVSSSLKLYERLVSLAKFIMSALRMHMDLNQPEMASIWIPMPQIIQHILDNPPPGDGRKLRSLLCYLLRIRTVVQFCTIYGN